MFLTLGNHVVSVEIFHEARKNPVEGRQFSYHVIHCNLANKPDRGLFLNKFEDRGLIGGRGGGGGTVLETGQVTLDNSFHFIKGITEPI